MCKVDFCRRIVAPFLMLIVLSGCGAEKQQITETGMLCTYESGASDTLVIGSTLLLVDGAISDGGLVVLSSGRIGDVGSFDELATAFPEASHLDCRGNTVLSPGWVNIHEHQAYSYAFPDPKLKAVYHHREDWILGRNDMLQLAVPDDQHYNPDVPMTHALLSWVELRHLYAGTTTLGGSGAMRGLARNIGVPRNAEGADAAGYTFAVGTEVFPFTRNATEQFAGVCGVDGVSKLLAINDSNPELAFAPHVGEGRKSDCTASAEIDAYLDYVAEQHTSRRRFAAVHAVATGPEQFARFAELDVTLAWAPRSNLALYGETIALQESQHHGVRLALGTDWSPSGSFNMLEEFSCARAVADKIGVALDDRDLWLMATHNAAYAVGIDEAVGQLKQGYYADIVLLRKQEGKDAYAAAVNASAADVAIVWLDGKPTFLESGMAAQMGLDSDCVSLTAEDKFLCADFETVGITWEDILVMTTDAVPINGDTTGQAPCNVDHLGK
ncbi:MAG: hypothetical protein CMO98_01780 [Woeseia sp.]|nr:hypothetical protein [Woeseia sp.]